MTWKEFKEKAEREGVRDDMEVKMIEVWRPTDDMPFFCTVNEDGQIDLDG